eukprot:2568268-Amphidinium_carterae.2
MGTSASNRGCPPEGHLFAISESEKYRWYSESTNQPYQFIPHSRELADIWNLCPDQRDEEVWLVHVARCQNFTLEEEVRKVLTTVLEAIAKKEQLQHS